MATHSKMLAWKSYGQRCLADYSPWEQSRAPLTHGTQGSSKTGVGCKITGFLYYFFQTVQDISIFITSVFRTFGGTLALYT